MQVILSMMLGMKLDFSCTRQCSSDFSKNIDGCVLDPPRLVHFWRIRYGYGINGSVPTPEHNITNLFNQIDSAGL